MQRESLRRAGRTLTILSMASIVPLALVAFGVELPDRFLGPAVIVTSFLGAPTTLATWILALYSTIKRFPGSRDERLVWMIVLFVCSFVGAWMYWLVGPGATAADASSAEARREEMHPVDARTLVIEKLADTCLIPAPSITDDSRLIEDLQLDSDDFGMTVVPELEKELGFEAPVAAWEEVRTVGDMLRVIAAWRS